MELKTFTGSKGKTGLPIEEKEVKTSGSIWTPENLRMALISSLQGLYLVFKSEARVACNMAL